MTVGPEPLKAEGSQLTVTGIFHDDQMPWLEAFPQTGGQVAPVQGDSPDF
jgi:hypothetical protein